MHYPNEIYIDHARKEIVSPRERRIAEKAYTRGYLSGGFDKEDILNTYREGYADGYSEAKAKYRNIASPGK